MSTISTADDAMTERGDGTDQYDVQWGIDVEADGPRDAAERARAAQLAPGSIATCFTVVNKATGEALAVDLSENTVEPIARP